MYNKYNIMVVYHKEHFTLDTTKMIFNPIQVGAINSEVDLLIKKDSVNENISEKNSSFCELTAMYYSWKNINADYVGLMHYRRYFSIKKKLNLRSKLKVFRKKVLKKIYSYDPLIKVEKKVLLNELHSLNHSLENIFQDYDFILPQKQIFSQSVRKHYETYHDINDWNKTKEIIKLRYPLFLRYFEEVSNSNELYTYNMFICSKKYFNDYSSWLFDILFELEKEINFTLRDKYQSRTFGFISERLLNVYVKYLIDKFNIKIKELRVIYCD